LNWPKSPAAILADISFVAAGERRDFRRLRTADPPRAILADISFVAAGA
jgi:hypothetical protein